MGFISHKQPAKVQASLQVLAMFPERTQSMKSDEGADTYLDISFLLIKSHYGFTNLQFLPQNQSQFLSSAPLVCFSSYAAYIANNMDPDAGLRIREGIGKLFSSFLIQNIYYAQ